MTQAVPGVLQETCYAVLYWQQHIADRAAMLVKLLEALRPALTPERCDLNATPRRGKQIGNVYTYGPEFDSYRVKNLTEALAWLKQAPATTDEAGVNSHFGVYDKLHDYNWDVTVANYADFEEFEDDPLMIRNDWHAVIAIRRARPKKEKPFQSDLKKVIECNDDTFHIPCYGLVTCQHPDQSKGIMSFTHASANWMMVDPEVRKLERKWWHPTMDRSTHVRGVYWGNLFGPKLVKILKERGDILNKYDAWRWTNADGKTEASPHRRVQYLANGSAFLSFTEDILDDSPSSGLWAKKVRWAVQLKAWLEGELRRIEVLKW